jgi:hypothetical protein
MRGVDRGSHIKKNCPRRTCRSLLDQRGANEQWRAHYEVRPYTVQICTVSDSSQSQFQRKLEVLNFSIFHRSMPATTSRMRSMAALQPEAALQHGLVSVAAARGVTATAGGQAWADGGLRAVGGLCARPAATTAIATAAAARLEKHDWRRRRAMLAPNSFAVQYM